MAEPSTAVLLGKIEPLQKYGPGGYHPIHIGDQLSNRFTVIDKLGWGSASTVWLAKDNENDDACVVVSVSKASAAEVYAKELMPKMQYLRSGDDEHAGKKSLLFPHDSFSISGPNGIHFCLVMTFEGQTVSRATNRAKGSETRPLPLAQAKKAVLDLGNAISYMHSMQITHNDLHPANFFLGVPKEEPWTMENFERLCGKPKIVELGQESASPSSDHVPKYLVLDALSHDVNCSLFKGPFKIADFGLAFEWSKENPYMSSAGPYIVPEFSAHRGIGGAADVWMFGCAIYQLLSGFDLMGTINDSAVKMVHQIMDVLGRPPEWVTEKWKGMFGESGVTPISEPRYPLAVRVQQLRYGDEKLGMKPRWEDFTEEDISVLTDLLSFILQLDPSKRPGIDQVLDHPTMAYFRV